MGCIPSKGGEVQPLAAKTEYQHALPSGGSGGKGEPQTARKSKSNEAASPAAAGAGGDPDAAANGKAPAKKASSLGTVNGFHDSPIELTGVSTEVNKTEATDLHSSEEPDAPLVAQADAPAAVEANTATATADPTPPLLPQAHVIEVVPQPDTEPPEADAPVEAVAAQKKGDSEGLPSSQQQAAVTVIQSHFRGHLVRRDTRLKMASSTGAGTTNKDLIQNDAKLPVDINKAPEEEIDIDLKDPDVEKAALKIQGAFKGLKMKRNSAGSPDDKNP